MVLGMALVSAVEQGQLQSLLGQAHVIDVLHNSSQVEEGMARRLIHTVMCSVAQA